MPITAASDAAANELDRDDYIKLLAKGTGLSSEQVDATNTAWEGLELTGPQVAWTSSGDLTAI